MASENTTEFSYDDEIISDVASVEIIKTVTSDPYLEYSYTSPLEHALVVTFFATVGLFGNGLTIHIYRQKRRSMAKTYIMALAVVDIVALTTMLPFAPFLKYTSEYSALNTLFTCIAHSIMYLYMWILFAMTVERFIAVFLPFKLKQWRQLIQRTIFVLCAVNVIISNVGSVLLDFTSYMDQEEYYWLKIINALNDDVIVLPLIFIIIAYIAIVLKMRNEGKTLNKCKTSRKVCLKSNGSTEGGETRTNTSHDECNCTKSRLGLSSVITYFLSINLTGLISVGLQRGDRAYFDSLSVIFE